MHTPSKKGEILSHELLRVKVYARNINTFYYTILPVDYVWFQPEEGNFDFITGHSARF